MRDTAESRREHIQTLERLGRLVVLVSPVHTMFVRLDAFAFAQRVA